MVEPGQCIASQSGVKPTIEEQDTFCKGIVVRYRPEEEEHLSSNANRKQKDVNEYNVVQYERACAKTHFGDALEVTSAAAYTLESLMTG